jgi:hypothetical protein
MKRDEKIPLTGETRVSTQPTAGYPHDLQLRARIQAFLLDEPGVVFPFSARLARENGWTRPFAARVVEEYRRFVYLAMTAGHPVSPSDEVDEVWHLHLTYTRSYWEEMCGRVLGRPLHHEPTKGGQAEGSKFVDWYTRTLDSYSCAFGHAPPPDVWPPPAERFAPSGRTPPVSRATHWMIRKPRLRRGSLATAVALGALLVVAACTGEERVASSVAVGFIVVLGAIGAYALLSGTTEVRRRRRRRGIAGRAGAAGVGYFVGDGGGSGGSCDGASSGDCGDGGGGGCGGGGCGGG